MRKQRRTGRRDRKLCTGREEKMKVSIFERVPENFPVFGLRSLDIFDPGAGTLDLVKS